MHVGASFEIKNWPQYDLGRRSTQQAVLRWIRTGKVWSVHLGTPCTVWAISLRGIKNFVEARGKELLGVRLALLTVEVTRECSR